MAPFEALYGRKYRTPSCWNETGEVSPVTGVGALKSRKLSTKFIGSFDVLSRISAATYQIALPPNLLNVHPVFHVLQLRKYLLDHSHVIDLDLIQVREDLSHDVYPVKIVDHRVKQLKGKEILLVKVTWNANDEGDVMWETKNRMKELYMKLFM
ncbi:uncharacterized protein LOC113874232 [Abrus precatorius]|uniref:Uncharacterized protein LOC113874232 n=1 Tax=Abrus precatorius TaxID=3816 RepID=A0A8B8MHS0_ABRPR|nr:uncharacterized protein LOC113874232 [Abrus precatorius]